MARVRASVPRLVLAYGYAVAVIAIALVVKIAYPSLGEQHPFLLIPAATVLATWYGGLGPGLLSCALGAVGAEVLFLAPDGTTSSDLVSLLVLLIEGYVIVFVTDSLREARTAAAAFGEEADRARRAVSFALSAREELLGLWAQKLTGPLAHVREAGRLVRQAVQSGDADAVLNALMRLEADIELLQRTTSAAISTEASPTALTR